MIVTSTAGTPRLERDANNSSAGVVTVSTTILKMISHDRNNRTPTRNNSGNEKSIDNPNKEILVVAVLGLIKGSGISMNNSGTSTNKVLFRICLNGRREEMDSATRMAKSKI